MRAGVGFACCNTWSAAWSASRRRFFCGDDGVSTVLIDDRMSRTLAVDAAAWHEGGTDAWNACSEPEDGDAEPMLLTGEALRLVDACVVK